MASQAEPLPRLAHKSRHSLMGGEEQLEGASPSLVLTVQATSPLH